MPSAKRYRYKIREYCSGWLPDSISEDLNSYAAKDWEVQQALMVPTNMEVSRLTDPMPGLNDGDRISLEPMMRFILRKVW